MPDPASSTALPPLPLAPILVTGGAGYIGSHTCVELLAAGHPVAVLDNFSNSSREVLARIEALAGQRVRLYEGDIRDAAVLDHALADSGARAVVHFAGLKAVGESVQQPLHYYDNNVVGTLRLLEAMGRAGVHSLVFSSSATVYGEPQVLPLTEDHPLSATNPYGRSKLVIEDMLRDLHRADPAWRIAILRYFNPAGAHASGTIGEDPQGVPNNLLPYVAQVAVGRRDALQVWGSDYDTPDGTGVRDYIMWWTWRWATSRHWSACRPGRSASRSTWAPAPATACWTSCAPSNRPAAARCPASCPRAAPAMWRPAMPTRAMRRPCWAGAPSATWPACAATPGTGSRATRRALQQRQRPEWLPAEPQAGRQRTGGVACRQP